MKIGIPKIPGWYTFCIPTEESEVQIHAHSIRLELQTQIKHVKKNYKNGRFGKGPFFLYKGHRVLTFKKIIHEIIK